MTFVKASMKMFTMAETVAILHVTRKTIYRYMAAGKLRAVRIGEGKRTGKLLFSEKELDRFLLEHSK